ncbi:MAG: Metal-pseudopaline receptor CntO [Candidatus Celerinatantimonas neptuna]|nr:MAG: Metal-pseudopaline receptor CntO [Candidatus Celerinatantimonas neptuna]
MKRAIRLTGLAFICTGVQWPAYASSQVSLDDMDVSAQTTQTTSKTGAPEDSQSLTINQLTANQIEQSQPEQLSDAISLLPGIQVSGSNSYSYVSRGFALSRDNVKIDGMNAWALKDNQIPLIAIERVDVLKGVGSMLYGSQSVGGTINVVTKKPQAKRYHEIQIEGGSYMSPSTDQTIGARHLAFDSTGAVDHQEHWLYRFLGDYKGKSGFADNQNTHGYYFSPMLTWQPDDHQSLIAQMELTRYTYNYASALVAPDSDISKVAAITTNYFGPQNEASDQGVSATLTYLRHLDNGWDSTTRWRSVWHRDERANFAIGSVSSTSVKRRYRHLRNHQLNHQLDSYLTGRMMTYGVSHDLTLGMSYAHTRNDFNRLNWGSNDSALTVSVYDPQFTQIDTNSISNSPGTHRIYTYDTYSLYAQDILGLTKKLNLQLANRFDWQQRDATYVPYTKSNGTFVSGSHESASEHYWTPTLGLSYRFTPIIRWHGSYAQSYATSGVDKTDASGKPFDPTRGIQYETGLQITPDQLWSAELNLFHIIKKNVIVTDVDGNNAALGRVRSQGAELSVTMQPTYRWKMKGAYTWLKTEVLKANQSGSSTQGNEFINAPRQRMTLQSNYQLLAPWSVGAVLIAQTHSYGSTDNQLVLPGYATVNLTSRYQINKQLRLDVGLKNLLNKTYYTSAKNANTIYAGEPRYMQAKLSYQF